MNISLLPRQKSITIQLKVVPSAKQTAFAGMLGPDTYKIRIAAAPEKGKANDALISFLSQELNIPQKQFTIISGHTSPLKKVQITLE